MKEFEIEYTTNIEDRQKVTVTANDLTTAYLNFIYANPIHYAITDMKEIERN